MGYVWEYGFADTYVSMIGNHYAVYYNEPENKVYLLNLVDGNMQLLEGIPANHHTNFSWNAEFSMLRISIRTESGAERLAVGTANMGITFGQFPLSGISIICIYMNIPHRLHDQISAKTRHCCQPKPCFRILYNKHFYQNEEKICHLSY